MGDVIDIAAHKPPIDAGGVLDRAKERDLQVVAIVGLDIDGELVVSTSSGNPQLDFWLLHRGAAEILKFFEPPRR